MKAVAIAAMLACLSAAALAQAPQAALSQTTLTPPIAIARHAPTGNVLLDQAMTLCDAHIGSPPPPAVMTGHLAVAPLIVVPWQDGYSACADILTVWQTVYGNQPETPAQTATVTAFLASH